MKQHTEHIATSCHAYTVCMGGTMDGVNTRDPVGYKAWDQAFEPNRFVRLENVGDDLVVNPWVHVNGRGDWRSLESILESILRPGMDDAEKARAVWEFARTHRYHYTTGDDEVKDTVKMLNVYGYTLCWDEAYTVSNLWQAAGFKVRRGFPHGHCTTEVYYDGEYRLLDSDEHLLCLRRDNRTVAGETDLARDHDLVKRSHAYGILQPESRTTSERGAALFLHDGPRTGGRPLLGNHRMDLSLRPGEALVWEWGNRGKYHGRWDPPPRFCNGRLHYVPDLRAERYARWAERAEGLVPAQDRNGRPALRPASAGREACLVYRMQSPYVFVGGKLEFVLGLAGPGDRVHVDLSWDLQTWEPVRIDTPEGSFSAGSLDPFFPSAGPARYAFFLRFRLLAARNPADILLSGLVLETDLQMAPLSLPALEVGDNRVDYTSDTEGPQAVHITHAWRERDAGPSPPAPARPHFPENGATVPGTQFTFEWEPVPDAVDYHFQLGESEDLRYRLSPTFEKCTSRTPAQGSARWQIPEDGLLNPGQTYFWRVRARNRHGLWGTWSPAWHFTPRAPAVPRNVRIEADRERRTLTLRWSPVPSAVRYEIHGSDERGFTARRQPYPAVTGNGEPETFPANLLAVTPDTGLEVAGPQIDDRAGNRAFYRVVAVNADGSRSGPSELAEAPRPFIVSLPPRRIRAGHISTYPVKAIRSIGELRCESRGATRYLAAFRDGDVLRHLLDEGPDWLSLDEGTGLLTAAPKAGDVSTHTVTLRVQNGQGGVDVQGFDLEVIP